MNLKRNQNIVELVGCYIFGVLLFFKNIYIYINKYIIKIVLYQYKMQYENKKK